MNLMKVLHGQVKKFLNQVAEEVENDWIGTYVVMHHSNRGSNIAYSWLPGIIVLHDQQANRQVFALSLSLSSELSFHFLGLF